MKDLRPAVVRGKLKSIRETMTATFSMTRGMIAVRSIDEEHSMRITDSQGLGVKLQQRQRFLLLPALAMFFLATLSLQAEPITPPYEKLTLLTRVAQVRQLKHDEAELGYPVRLRGVVTYYDRDAEIFFIQDSTAGIFVNSSGMTFSPQPNQMTDILVGPLEAKFRLQAGQLVEIEG